jgi:inorganic pyrophosphatase
MKTSNKLKIFVYIILVVALVVYLTTKDKNFYVIPAFASDEIVNAVIEIPAGTNKKIEYNPTLNEFQVDELNGKKRIIDFLPYPFNYGFIPSTYMDPNKEGDGDAIDIVILSESQPSASVMRVKPIGMIQLLDNGEIDTKIIAIPEDENLRIINAKSIVELENNYPAVIDIIENWFLHYKGESIIEIEEWKSKRDAIYEIKRWQK